LKYGKGGQGGVSPDRSRNSRSRKITARTPKRHAQPPDRKIEMVPSSPTRAGFPLHRKPASTATMSKNVARIHPPKSAVNCKRSPTSVPQKTQIEMCRQPAVQWAGNGPLKARTATSRRRIRLWKTRAEGAPFAGTTRSFLLPGGDRSLEQGRATGEPEHPRPHFNFPQITLAQGCKSFVAGGSLNRG